MRALRRAKATLSAIRNVSSAISRIADLEARLEYLTSRVDAPLDLYDRLAVARCGADYGAAYSVAEPLVSVCIATFNRCELLTERSLKSILNQSYKNLQIVVIGDGCTDDTERRMSSIRDSRVSFANLKQRGNYPSDPDRRWLVAGTDALNQALRSAEGQFVTHLDDDDFHFPDRIEKLLGFIREQQAEVVFHPFYVEVMPGEWLENPAQAFQLGWVTTSSVFYHRFFSCLPWDVQAHLIGEPGDWNRLRKFRFAGAKIARCPEILLRHFREKNQPEYLSNIFPR